MEILCQLPVETCYPLSVYVFLLDQSCFYSPLKYLCHRFYGTLFYFICVFHWKFYKKCIVKVFAYNGIAYIHVYIRLLTGAVAMPCILYIWMQIMYYNSTNYTTNGVQMLGLLDWTYRLFKERFLALVNSRTVHRMLLYDWSILKLFTVRLYMIGHF